MNAIRHLSSAAVLTVIVSTVAVGPAAAQPDAHEKFHLADSFTFDVCDPSFTLRQDVTVDGQSKSDTRPDGTVHNNSHSIQTNLFTNLDTGKILTEKFLMNFNGTLTPNADGGLTQVQVFPENDQWFSADGKLIAHGAGVTREVLVFDQNGVPVSVESTSHGSDKNVGELCALMK